VAQTIVIGAGQAALALSYHLSAAGHDHLLLERGRIGERWRSERWDSLRMLTPNWLNRLPGAPPHADADGYLPAADFAEYLRAYARSFRAPVVEGVSVRAVERAGDEFCVRTDQGADTARAVVIATGDSDLPWVPAIAAQAPPALAQLHGAAYRSPAALAEGGVLVVGAGPSGQQIALELRRAGRDVVLAVGRHARGVRRYRGRDIWHWLAELGSLDQTIEEVANPEAARRTPNLPLSGAHGGERLDLRVLADAGVVVTGRLTGFDGTRARFGWNLDADVCAAEQRLRRVLGRIDAHVGAMAPEPVAPVGPLASVRSRDLRAAGVTTVLWATGYRRAYPWLHVPVVGADGELLHRRGVTPVPGLYALGLRFQHRRSSHLIGGVGHDAEYLAERILAAAACPALAAA
jgi:putative flavoprotein involved in K+ transport